MNALSFVRRTLHSDRGTVERRSAIVHEKRFLEPYNRLYLERYINRQKFVYKDTLKIIAGKESMITRRAFFPSEDTPFSSCLQRVTNCRRTCITSRNERA